MNKTESIVGLKDIIDRYDVFILDLWGVMHNGEEGYTAAIKCVETLHEVNKKLIIISNSSKRKHSTAVRLSDFGYRKIYFLEIMTSGEMIWQSLVNLNHDFTKKLQKNCFHIYDKSKEDGKKYLEGLEKFNFVANIEEADFILGCTPQFNTTTIDYIPLLTKAIKNKLPFVCANPDFVSIENSFGKPIICMGTIAELYKNMGGEVFILGKPSCEIYEESTKKISNLDKSKILAVGDSIHHDIAGANNFGIDSLLITSGIHHDCFDQSSPQWQSDRNKLQKFENEPTFVCSNFNN